jgi:sulfite reductase (NADPH) flavoprotein alpha-component
MAVVPVVPDSAPFTPAQRAWLNGFLAGMLGGHAASAAQGASPDASSERSATVEVETAHEGEFPWHDPAMAIDDRMKLAEGRPHERRLMAAMAQLDCGACGYLCKTYAEAIACGEEKDLTRCTPGGRETARMLKQVCASVPAAQKEKVIPVSEVGIKKAASNTESAGAWDRNNPFPARLLRCMPLNGAGSAKDTRLVILDLQNSGLTYKVGDALGVFPENCPELVQDILHTMDASGAEDVPGWDGQPISLHDALQREFAISRPTPDLLDLLSRCASDSADADALRAMRDDENGAGDLQVLDLFHRFRSARPAPGDLVATLSPLAPRLYSISSSPAAHPKQVHLTVGAVRYVGLEGRPCKGVASTYLAERVRPGQKVRVFVHTSHKFGLPAGDRHAIMVGPGTGIAPFRAFLQERAATGSAGKNWLLFGDQKSDCDFLYRAELEQYQKDGVLHRLDTAFSRDQEAKVYVQHRMIERGAELWAWLADGGCFYVCGDAKRMALDVDKALRQVISEHGKLAPVEADKYVAELIRAGRYQRDVY